MTHVHMIEGTDHHHIWARRGAHAGYRHPGKNHSWLNTAMPVTYDQPEQPEPISTPTEGVVKPSVFKSKTAKYLLIALAVAAAVMYMRRR